MAKYKLNKAAREIFRLWLSRNTRGDYKSNFERLVDARRTIIEEDAAENDGHVLITIDPWECIYGTPVHLKFGPEHFEVVNDDL